MSQYRPPELPWSDSGDGRRFRAFLWVLLLIVLVSSIAVPLINLPQKDRSELEKLPPQLAKIIERKKKEIAQPPKPELKPEPKIEPEPKPEPKPESKPEPKPLPKPEPKPERKPEVKATEEKRAVAKEKAKEAFGADALAALSRLRSEVPVAALKTSSSGLSNAGNKVTSVGSVVDRAAASRSSGGVDVATLTTATAGETLSDRTLTAVELTPEQVAQTKESRKRSQEELRLAFETYNLHYDRIYRGALRANPTLAGAVTLALVIEPNGSVSECKAIKSELKDDKLIRRLESKCRQMQFADRPGLEVTKAEYPIRFNP